MREAADLLSALQHERNLIDADTQRGITDCSTPLFQRVRNIVAIARAKGKHAHMGRVAGPSRWKHAESIGIQTVDSSGYSKFFDEMVGRTTRWKKQPTLRLSA